MKDADEVGRDLRALAAEPALGPHATSLTALADDLTANDAGNWVGIDLFALFPEDDIALAAPDRRHVVTRVMEAGRGVLLFMPLIVTWLGIFFAIRAYDELLGATREEQAGLADASFLEMWATGFGGRTWATFDRIALLDALFILLVVAATIGAHVLRARLDDEDERRRAEVAAPLRAALLDASLVIASQAGTTPQRLPREVTKVIGVLKGTLLELRTAQEELAASLADGHAYIKEMAKAGTELVGATKALHAGAGALGGEVKGLSAGVTSLTGGARELDDRVRSLVAAGDVLTRERRGLTEAQDRTVARLSEAADVPLAMSAAAKVSADALAGAVEGLPGQMAAMQEKFLAALEAERSDRARALGDVRDAGATLARATDSAREVTGELGRAIDALHDERSHLAADRSLTGPGPAGYGPAGPAPGGPVPVVAGPAGPAPGGSVPVVAGPAGPAPGGSVPVVAGPAGPGGFGLAEAGPGGDDDPWAGAAGRLEAAAADLSRAVAQLAAARPRRRVSLRRRTRA